jgi:hypothetical protein
MSSKSLWVDTQIWYGLLFLHVLLLLCGYRPLSTHRRELANAQERLQAEQMRARTQSSSLDSYSTWD